MRRELVTTTYLEMRDPAHLRRASEPAVPAQIIRAEIASPTLNRFLYAAVGGDWHWTDRLSWDYARWQQYLDRPQVQTWVLYVRGTIAGYIELETQDGGNVELAYFGLIREFIGQGLGGHLLSIGIEKAWAINGTQRVWVHTCTLDGTQALANYQARGMTVYKIESAEKDVAATPGPWPGAYAS
jgi:ribosomal protein S18 acetylase RimI-like enzyme